MKLGELTGELTECDGGDFDAPCPNMVRVRHDPYSTAQLALCSPCNFGGGEVYGPLDEPYTDEEVYEHTFEPECCANCREYIADQDRYAEECDAAAEEERMAQERPPTLWARIRYWVARLLRRRNER